MAKIYKGKDLKEKPKAVKTILPVNLSIIAVTGDSQNPHWVNSLNKLKPELHGNFEMVLVKRQSTNMDEFEKDTVYKELKENHLIKIIEVSNEIPFVNAALQGMLSATKDFVTVIDTDSLRKPLIINDLFHLKKEKATEHSVFIPEYDIDKNLKKKKKTSGFPVIMPLTYGIHLYESLSTKGRDYLTGLNYILKKSGAHIEKYNIHQSDPFENTNNDSGVFRRFMQRRSAFLNWFVLIPIKEMKSRERLFSGKESSVFRLLFVSIAAIMLIAMMFMGYHAGMSGDEHFHYEQANNVFNYYKTFGKDSSAVAVLDPKGGESTLKFYGQSFDLLTVIFIKTFHVEKIYETRHVFNSIFGWLAILFCALIAVEIAGWRAGVIGLFLLFISPGFLGHSFNNPKDIPFAMGYVMSLYFMIRFFKEFPKPSVKAAFLVACGIAVSISIRVAGVMQIAYLFMFTGLYYIFVAKNIKQLFSKENMKNIQTTIIYCCAISIAAYFMGILPWPYGLEAPLKNPLRSLTEMNKFAVSLRQIFEGAQIWSDKVPWYYSSKYILITVPVVVILGAAAYLVQAFSKNKRLQYLLIFILVFSFVFPLFYIAYQHSNVFGGWRHVLFVYPPMVSMAAVGFGSIFNKIRKKYIAWVFAAILLALSFKPAIHIIRNYPYQYVYFNEFTGGVKGAYGKYETDYYYHGLKGGCEWFAKNIKTDTVKPANPILVASNHTNIVSYFLRDLIKQKKVKILYSRYYERGNSNWDYYIAANSYLNPFRLVNHIFPPKNTIFTVNVEGEPICAVIKRNDKSDYYGFLAENKNDLPGAIALLDNAIRILPENEAALLNLSEIYYKMQNVPKAEETINKLLKIYPDYENALNYQGWILLAKGDANGALKSFKKIEEVNFKFYYAYYGAAKAYLKINDVDSAIGELEKSLEQNQGFKPAYILLGNIYQYKAKASSQKGDQQTAQDYMRKAQEYMNVAQQLP